MFSNRNRVYFYDRLGVINYFSALITNKKVFYNSLTSPLRSLESIFLLNFDGVISRIYYGSLDSTTNIRKAAYELATKELMAACEVIKLINSYRFLNFESEVPVEKIFFDHFYSKYEFVGYASKFAQENPQICVTFISNKSYVNLRNYFTFNLILKKKVNCYWLQYLSIFVFIPVLYYVFLFKNLGPTKPKLNNAVICEVDDPKIIEMFRSLFGKEADLHFVTHKKYINDLSSEQSFAGKISIHRFDRKDNEILWSMTKRFLLFLIINARDLILHVAVLVDVFKTFIHGFLITPNVFNSVYLTFEHLSPVKSVRNALLTTRNSKSIFVPYNVYAVDHFFSHEYKYNYDILCSPGKLLEKVYVMQSAVTNVVLPIGAYSPHKGVNVINKRTKQIDKISKFKKESTLITILSSGIHEGSYSGELKLFLLAQRLSNVPGLKVVIRQKPGKIPAKYSYFFNEIQQLQENLILTHDEFDLFDFLPVTDLFITSISSSAVDLCVAGAQFYSIDFWRDHDLYLWQTIVEGVFIPQNKAYETIKKWIDNSEFNVRQEHKARMKLLSDLLSYKHLSFENYRENFIEQLTPFLPSKIL